MLRFATADDGGHAGQLRSMPAPKRRTAGCAPGLSDAEVFGQSPCRGDVEAHRTARRGRSAAGRGCPWCGEAACPTSATAGSAAPRRAIPIHNAEMLCRVHPWAGVESVRRLSAVSVGTGGSTTPCWSNLSGLTSTNGSVPQLLPFHTRKVAGSIPAGTTNISAANGLRCGTRHNP